MSIPEILELERQNTGITLHKEGIFWRAYERSAYLFVNHIKEYQLTKKIYKNVKQEVVYLGFPQTSLKQILELVKDKTIQKEDNQIIINVFKFKKNKFKNIYTSCQQQPCET